MPPEGEKSFVFSLLGNSHRRGRANIYTTVVPTCRADTHSGGDASVGREEKVF